PDQTVTPSARTSATAHAGPMLACDWNGHSYSASTTRAAVLNAEARSPFFTGSSRLATGALRMWSCSAAISGKGASLAWFQLTLSIGEARTASHSRSARTATNSLSRTTRARFTFLIEPSSTLATVQAARVGRITRAWGIVGRDPSAAYFLGGR